MIYYTFLAINDFFLQCVRAGRGHLWWQVRAGGRERVVPPTVMRALWIIISAGPRRWWRAESTELLLILLTYVLADKYLCTGAVLTSK